MTDAPDPYIHSLENYLATWATEVGSFSAEIGALPFTDVMNTLLPGGKRLRALFLSAGWRIAGGQAGQHTEIAAGAAVELFQLAALVHDDLIDRSDTRRGIPAAHRQFGNLLSSDSHDVDTERFSLGGAVLLGDMLTVAASQVFEDALTHVTPDLASRARRHFQEMMLEVTFGQYLDVSSQFQPFAQNIPAEKEHSWHVLKHKSARYSIEHPLTLGAMLAGSEPELTKGLAEIGLLLGEAFQLRDDVLGLFGDPAEAGKPIGDDIREGKRTILILETAQRCNIQELTFLASALGKNDLTAAEVERVRGLVAQTKALETVEAYIEERLQRALELLRPYQDLEGAAILVQLAQKSSHRAM